MDLVTLSKVMGTKSQGGGTPLQSVLRGVTAVKILTKIFYNGIVTLRFITEILLDLDQLDRVYQRDIVP